MKIGFIGTGVMGSSIVRHLLKSGYKVHLYNRTKEKTDTLVEAGAVWEDSPGKVSEIADVIFTMLGYPRDVEEVYFGKNGIFSSLLPGKIVVDMTTSTPSLAAEIAAQANRIGASSLDAPVSGGDLGARNGTLTVMVGGEQEVFKKVQPILKIFSADLRIFGEAGSGQHAKMANQIMVAGTMTGLTEMLVYAKEAGLNLEEVIKTLSGGAAQNWSLSNYGPRILAEDYTPGFFVKHFVKDLKIALDEAERMHLNLPSTKQALELYERLEKDGHGDKGTQALINLWWSC